MTPNDMDALCACCDQPTPATSFPAICAYCRGPYEDMQATMEMFAKQAGVLYPLMRRAHAAGFERGRDPWLDALTVGDAAFLHELKIDPLG